MSDDVSLSESPVPSVVMRIRRGSLHQEVVARLRDMIIEGELAPGEKLRERLLCERFGISRTPLREALKVLAADGLVELNPSRGALVARLKIEEIDEIFSVMGALEALSGELAAARITEEEIAEIRVLHAQMLLHYTRGELASYFALNQRIHERILEAARNPTLAAVYRNLAGRARRARYLANMSKRRWAQAVEEHEQILAALAARDGQTLATLLKAHLRNKGETVKEALAVADDAGNPPLR
ncbi:MAG TPA: GntR family transcriptional regulator [Alphaproteobacteria bacterium]|nr:GntR family transcriptional regulator [Alphaproteobacteria bacterium]